MDPKRLTPADLLQRARAMRREAPLAEQKLWQHLRARRLGGFKFRRQDPVPPFIADFVCEERKLVVEVDGESHEEQPDYDARRTQRLERDGYTVLRFGNAEAIWNTEGVLKAILRECEERARAK
jgi:very-short-patch-repair endonuclease